MQKTIFKIPKMDCPTEEQLIRMALNDIPGIKELDFDIAMRKLTVYHKGPAQDIENAIMNMPLGAQKLSTEPTQRSDFNQQGQQKRLLLTVLAINLGFFVIEMIYGLLSRSMGLVADSMDMLADSFVYGISLFAVGATLTRKKRIARLAGYFQIALALIGFIEVIRRFFRAEQLPDFHVMIYVSILTLIANGTCLYLLLRSKSKEEAHIKASMIFSSNDVIINSGVIIAGVLVHLLQSNKPDLIIGSIVFVLVIHGAIRILKLGGS